jgi:DNA-binding TFAR19-related protein (PDSD5 family)
MSTAQQAILDAARSDVQTGGTSALQQLALSRQGQAAQADAQRQAALNQLFGDKARSQADIIQLQQNLMSQGIESLLGGMQEGAVLRAKTVQEYGPAKKKDKGRNLPIGGKGKNKGRK